MSQKKRLAVLVSGRGTNLKALIDFCENSPVVEIAVVISDNPQAPGLEHAKKANIKTCHLPDGRERNETLLKRLTELSPDLIVLAGYMRVVPKSIVDRFYGKIINIHPSLLPKFPGLDAQKQALDAKETVSGCTVHFVDANVDSGPIILQHKVQIEKGDTVETLSARILEFEHKILIKAVDLFCRNKLLLRGRNVEIVK